MDQKPSGRDLFIVDNSVSGWTGLRYLEEWTGIAKSFDIATGHFEIGALLALDGKWQKFGIPDSGFDGAAPFLSLSPDKSRLLPLHASVAAVMRMRPSARLRGFALMVISMSWPSAVSRRIRRSLEKFAKRPFSSADTFG